MARSRFGAVLGIAALTIVVLAASAGATTITGTAAGPNGSHDTWNNPANWDLGIPSGAVDAVVAAGVTAECWNDATPAYTGTLTLQDNSVLQIGWTTSYPNSINALGGSGITMNAGSQLRLRMPAPNPLNLPELTLLGDASIHLSPSTSAHHRTRNFDNPITGTGALTVIGNNNNTLNFNAPNPGWSGDFIANADDGWRVEANATGAFGTGDVIINARSANDRGATLVIDAPDVIADTASLFLNGPRDQRKASKLILNANDTVAGFWVDGSQMPPGVYDSSSGLTDILGNPLITGNGVLTVSGGPAPPATLVHVATDQVSNNHSVFDVSVFPGKAGYNDGTDSGVFGDGTVADYRFFDNSGTTFNGAGYANGGAGLVSEATATNASGLNGGPLDWADVWTTNDPDSAPANFTTDTVARAQGVSGTVDISGFESGSLYFIYGSYSNPNTIALTMSGPGQPDVVAEHTEDPPAVNQAWISTFDFSDAAAYDTISYLYTNTDTDGSRARFMGVIVDGVPLSGTQVGATAGDWVVLRTDNPQPSVLEVDKRANSTEPFDMEITVTGGLDSIEISEAVENNTNLDWLDYHMELGFGLGDDFVSSTPGDALEFANASSLTFPGLELSGDSLTFNGGLLDVGGTAAFDLTIDLPGDDPFTFTLRQWPSVVPEPATLSLLGLGALLALRRRRRNR